jgi:hypothetical protein
MKMEDICLEGTGAKLQTNITLGKTLVARDNQAGRA